ncbi:MBL fold metallo-hydrolase [Reticulibacter mediterranei]|uniref:MBL fold metallo-hydrolase n=1 Tax=Reticulibacter mediterranei TaxID=2778369 RepID=A0A8J3N8S1_9CHLR|nr:MBL fold metallo-hydrolase [Reticulibacter mediterranei]GHO99835.1 MBL fold metallo-hydrolase [Reticulibacter mediterranei]
MQSIALHPIQSVTITIVLDNLFDGLLPNQGVAKRPGFSSQKLRLPATTMEERVTFDTPQAQHGFSALITLPIEGRLHQILFDTGSTPNGLVENMRVLDLSPKDIETVVLSHGHFDHTTGLDGLARTLGRANLPLLIHPEFWNRRRLMIPGRNPMEFPTTSKSALQGVGFEIIEERRPSFLLNGSLLITGEVDRTTSFEHGMPGQQAFRGGEWVADSLILDDQALVLNVQDKGLVVLTGCGHSGVVNVVRYAQKLTGIEQVYAILGGFHLSGAVFEPLIDQTCDALAAFEPKVLVPTHCTGFRAIHQLAARLPAAFIQSSVGTRFEL